MQRTWLKTPQPQEPAGMEYKPEWHDGMEFIADARQHGWTNEQMVNICRLAREDRRSFLALIRAYDEDPKGFVSALEGMAESGPKAVAEQEKRLAQQQKHFADVVTSLSNDYRALARNAFTLPTRAKGKAVERRIHHRSPWLTKTPGLAPLCQNGHVMDFAVLITAKELDLCMAWEKHRSGAVFFACTDEECLNEEDNGRLVVDSSVYNRVLAASDCEPQPLPTFDDLPRSNEPTVWQALRPKLSEMNDLEADRVLQAVIKENSGIQRAKIGGYAAYWNLVTCHNCKSIDFSNVVELAEIPDILDEDDHWVVSVCNSCHHVQCGIEGS